MMRALWAGVTGLQAHQIAMDTEGNNIANVNTTGFKYSRANFSTLLSQTSSIATAPTGTLGGQNSTQIGLGTTVSTVTKIFNQGSIETTDKNTDLAISGDGFFVVSPDGGTSYKYTRDGNLTFDASGNFVDSNGYIVQGWLKDSETGKIDTTSPISNITIPPGLTTPASATTKVTVKANLDSGTSVGTHKSAIYSLDSNSGWYDTNGDGIMQATEVHNEDDTADNLFNTDSKLTERGIDFGVLFDSDGSALGLTEGQGEWISYAKATTSTTITADASGTTTIDMTINGTAISGSITSTDDAEVASYIAGLISAQSSSTGVEATVNGNKITLTNDNSKGTEASTKNIKLDVNGGTDTTGFADTEVITAYQYTYTSSASSSSAPYDDSSARTFTSTEDLRAAIQKDARHNVDYTGDGAADLNDGVTVTVNSAGQYVIANPAGDALNADDGDIIDTATSVTSTYLNGKLATQAISFPVGTTFASDVTVSADVTINGTLYAAGSTIPAGTTIGGTDPVTIPEGSTFDVLGADTILPVGTNFKGADDYDLYISVTNLTNTANSISANSAFSTVFSALGGTLSSGTTTRTSGNIYAASLASSTDIYDSLGSKHTLRIEYTKIGTTASGGSEWSMTISVPKPAEINTGIAPENIVTGTISFNSDGSLATYTPRNLNFTGNNGSTANQNVSLNLGSIGQFDGMTSFDKDSNTSNITPDGYAGGDLTGISIDETGTIIGSFSNGYSFALAQVAMATFSNNGGLESDGGNCYIQSTNSGTPIVGQASTGSKGSIQSSALEMSNVDLSRSLTQLIVIQRGYQANSKTITTADEMLNTLLQLK